MPTKISITIPDHMLDDKVDVRLLFRDMVGEFMIRREHHPDDSHDLHPDVEIDRHAAEAYIMKRYANLTVEQHDRQVQYTIRRFKLARALYKCCNQVKVEQE